MNDAGLGNSPAPARPFDVTDEQLSAELKQWTGTAPALHPVGELLDRHWEAAFAYARLCTDGTRGAGMLTTAAFTRLFGESLRQAGPTAAWRPQLLVTVRRIAAEWDNDGRGELLHPELRAGTGERAAARLLPPANRRLLSRAFQRLTQSSRAVLWHIEVESEPLSTPAALLGLDEQDARVELRRSRERLREECLQVHRELAHEDECQRYVRMIDVTFRRGGSDIDRDLQQHLNGCKHCGFTADQLHQFNGGLGLALAEAVLGWGARGYLESRAGLTEAPVEPAPVPVGGFTGGEAFAPAGPGKDLVVHPVASRRAEQRAARRARRRNLTVAVGTVSGLVVLPLVLWAVLGTGDDAGTAAAKPSAKPGAGSATSGPSWAGSNQTAQGTLRGRLHNLASGLCIGVVGKKAVKGAETELAECSSAAGQQWTYDADGLLRNGADPGLCLDSHLGYSVRLAPCSATGSGGRSIRYDFTLQGALVPRWDQDLALAPAATDGGGSLVVKNRADVSAQRWVMDTSQPDLQMQIVNWDAETTPSPTPTPTAAPSVKAARTPTPAPTPSASTTTAQPTPSSGAPGYNPCEEYPGYCYGGGQYGGGWGGGGGYGGGYGGGHHR
ncbi:RICIN domain-containing protein [Streptomyces arenae]|uniref:RICIN domain-containing protein n=1 Tax=Streptomyces arenae TaxID=29301 RepID=UPI002658C593|nr:RICIN domain-containing protein [Streptomyces arenae]MCG7209116.1 RICIN domain-containing protein [Streptomyces arenae]